MSLNKAVITALILTLFALPASAAFTVIKSYRITVNIPESVATEETISPDETQAEKPEERMTTIERMWRDSQVLLVRTTVVK